MKLIWWSMMVLWALAVAVMTVVPLWLVFALGRSPGALAVLCVPAAAGGALILYSDEHPGLRAVLLLRGIAFLMWALAAVALTFGPFWLACFADASLWSLLAVPVGVASGCLLLFAVDAAAGPRK